MYINYIQYKYNNDIGIYTEREMQKLAAYLVAFPFNINIILIFTEPK